MESDCSVQIFKKNDEIFKDLIQTVALPYMFYCVFFLEILKKSSESDQSTIHFQSVPPTHNLIFFPVNQLVEKFCPNVICHSDNNM